MITRRLAAALAALPLLAACAVSIDWCMDKALDIQAPAGGFEQVLAIDPAEYGPIADHSGNIQDVSLGDLRVTVNEVRPGHQATAVSLWLRVRPAGAPEDGSQDLVAGQVRDLPFVAGSTATIPADPAVSGVLLSAVRDLTPFTVLVTGTIDGAADASLQVQFVGSLSYGLF